MVRKGGSSFAGRFCRPNLLLLSVLGAGIVALGGGLHLHHIFSHAPRGERLKGIEALEASGDVPAALAMAEGELILHPGDPSLLRKAGRLRFQMGDFPAGKGHFEALISADSHPAAAWAELASLWDEVHGFWDAFHAAEAALRADPEVPGARALLARCQVRNNRFEEARDLIGPKESSGKADREELLAYGEALLRLGEAAKASDVLGKALAQPGSSAESRCIFGEALLACGEVQKAADRLSEILEEEPFHVRSNYFLARALNRLGRNESAQIVLKAYKAVGWFEQRWIRSEESELIGQLARASATRAGISTASRRSSTRTTRRRCSRR